MRGRLQWEQDGHDWPNRACSRFVMASGLRWHVQVMGRGPALLLLHGTGAATHSWRDLAPLLARDFTVIAPDLPGHGFSDALFGARMSLPGMAAAVAGLLQVLDTRPELVVGHSAGAAILARLCLDDSIRPVALISLNGALLPLHGLPKLFFAPAAKLLVSNALAPRLFAWHAQSSVAVQRLITSTGSQLDPVGVELYARLVRNPEHVANALAMMASWDLQPLARDLRHLKIPLLLVAGSNDRTLRPEHAHQVAAQVPHAQVLMLAGLGHLAHEENPRKMAEIVVAFRKTETAASPA